MAGRSGEGPKLWLIPMQPRPMAETVSWLPSVLADMGVPPGRAGGLGPGRVDRPSSTLRPRAHGGTAAALGWMMRVPDTEDLDAEKGGPMTEGRPPYPPFDEESARQKVQAAEDAWNTRDPH